MSHFTVLVVTENGTEDEIHAALAPFHEFECTGVDDAYVQDIDMTETTQKDWDTFNQNKQGEYANIAEWLTDWHGVAIVPQGTEPDLAGEHKYAYAILDAEGNLVKHIDRTNPNSRWDWYQIGGRWSRSLVIKEGAQGFWGTRSYGAAPGNNDPRFVDIARVGDLDWDTMIQDTKSARRETVDVVVKKIQDAYPGTTPEQADTIRAELVDAWRIAEKAYDDARASGETGVQLPWERVRSMSPSLNGYLEKGLNLVIFDLLSPAISPEFRTFQEYLDAPISPITSYAFLDLEGEWHSRGDMGWFGISNDGMSATDWATELNKALKALPSDVYIAMVDCHT